MKATPYFWSIPFLFSDLCEHAAGKALNESKTILCNRPAGSHNNVDVTAVGADLHFFFLIQTGSPCCIFHLVQSPFQKQNGPA